ncbi:glycosyltransferase family 4 protein [Pedobacter yulinensis]|uniref:Glycosyltransferase family 4 protein n=1 Tax=Pedobacter yulinensis TaxID=2126353 RepID=A0A2T3HNC3_9SPHI|nr:glycosyltransferase family 4 protein [Pedobacter yulinensis]PST83945.1 glycosyltransferase family 4 protein [Pedobacter yulinensis]
MKIGIIAHLKHPIRKPFMGGLEAFTHEVTSHLIARGHDVTLFASEQSDPELGLRSILSDEDYNRQTLSRFPSHELVEDFISTHHAYLELMQDIDREGFDVIFNNSLNYVPITMATLISTPMVTVLHTPPIFEMKRAAAQEQKIGKIRYVSVSKSNAVAWKPYISDCEIISNGINLDKWDFHDRNDGNYVVWFGRIHPDKGTHLAIEAAGLAGYPIKVAGSIADRHYFETYVRPLLGAGAELLDHLDHAQLNKLIGGAAASVITPCWEEPFGLVIAESLACGTPVAGFARGALPNLVCPETGRLTSSSDPQDLAHCIAEAARLDRGACRRRAEDRLSIETMISSYEALFSEVAANRYLSHAV